MSLLDEQRARDHLKPRESVRSVLPTMITNEESMTSKESTSMPRRRPLARGLLLSALAAALLLATANFADADAGVTVKYATQRMSDATLKSTQVGSYAKGRNFSARCWTTGQNVRNDAGSWSTRWYRDSAGWFSAAVDLSYPTNKTIPGTSECGRTVPGLTTTQWYSITNNNSGKRVDVRGGSNANGTALQQYTPNSTASQLFRFTSLGGRFFRVESKLAGSNVWDVSKSNGTSAQVWAWAGLRGSTSNQQWLVYSPSGKLGDVEFRSRQDTNKCVGVPGGSLSNGVQLRSTACNSARSQRFTLKAVGEVNPAPYKLPFPKGTSYVITQSPGGSYSHHDSYNKDAIDFGLNYQPVAAAAAGKVYFAGYVTTGAGTEILIDHGGNRCSQYAHLSRADVSKGASVKQGQRIGVSGQSGAASGPHLHFNIVACSTEKSLEIPRTVERGTSYPTGLRVTSQNG